jgi:hypothetical protein
LVKEYTTRFYVSEIEQGMRIEQDNYEQARISAAWKDKVKRSWPSLDAYADGRWAIEPERRSRCARPAISSRPGWEA